MSSRLYFSGRADDASTAATFLDLVQESAQRQRLEVERQDRELTVHMATDADDVVIQLNDGNLFEGSMKASAEDPQPDLKALALLFTESHRHLSAFLLVDDNSQTLFEHGDVEAMEALLDEDLKEKVAGDMAIDEDALGPLDTKWFTNARVFQHGKNLVLQISLDARSKINDKEWTALTKQIPKIKGITNSTTASNVLGFELTVTNPTPEDAKRIAIASSFMIDDAVIATREAKTTSSRLK